MDDESPSGLFILWLNVSSFVVFLALLVPIDDVSNDTKSA